MSEEEKEAIEIMLEDTFFWQGKSSFITRHRYKELSKKMYEDIEKLQKVIDLMAIELFNYANLNILGICEAELENGNYDMNLCKMSLANRNCCECIKKHFYKKVEEEK